jgi:hypothetical protein
MEETGDPRKSESDGDDLLIEVAPIDVQRLLTWYFDLEHPGRHHISSPHDRIA